MNKFLVEQMAMYSSYHRNAKNRATHMLGIPMIMMSLLVPTSWVIMGPISLSAAIALAAIIYYLWLDRLVGSALGIAIVLMLWAAQWLAMGGQAVGWPAFGILFVGGWIIQFIGHAFEGRRPALTDNFLQTLIAPMFIMTEILVAMGLKKDLHDAVEARWQAYADKKSA